MIRSLFLALTGVFRTRRRVSGMSASTPDPTDEMLLERLSNTLLSLRESIAVDQYGSWWKTVDGVWFYQELTVRLGQPLSAWVNRMYGQSLEPLDVAGAAVEILASEKTLDRVTGAANPWAYLGASLRNELSRQAGRYFREQQLDHDFFNPVAPAFADESLLTPLDDAVDLTVSYLFESTPVDLQPKLHEAVLFFAERGNKRLSHLYTEASRNPELLALGFSPQHILAIANIVLGRRPLHGETSVLAKFLKDSSWSGRRSIEHRNALSKYKRRMVKASTAGVVDGNR